MAWTDYQAKYFAHVLTARAPADSPDRLASVVAGAQVDLNPHQVDAALFAFRSPLSRGALLADEVGLGKTIEAGLVLAQHWAERKRHLLVIVPANLRKQWYQEMTEKFFLPCEILESRSFTQARNGGRPHPFMSEQAVIICSYQFARSRAIDIAATPWDLVVIDEAHRLRNVYQPSRKVANAIKEALGNRRKLLLTATPLQNSLLELYGLVSLIDDHTFGDLESFREHFMGATDARTHARLKSRLEPICTRTLRRQVEGYVSYTRRQPILEEFTPEEAEDTLYEMVSEYLRRPNLQALPSGQRALMTLVLRKLLASSTFAIAGALNTMSERLKAELRNGTPEALDQTLAEDYEGLDETREEWESDPAGTLLSPAERKALEDEIRELDAFKEMATSITSNAKGQALLKALSVAMERAAELGAAQKAIIFTESRRTQEYIQRILAESPWGDGIVLFNGSNSDPRSREIYAAWLKEHQGTDRVTGSRTADLRSALVDYFRDEGQIMIATEAAAEGINLQFCSLVVNYDLPWNPQRIEQRIGRCHRYGQKHDVVVVNFLNRKNQADQRVYELLSEKFQLFAGVFGASDEVLGAIDSGVDFEKRINDIYQTCRRPEEIDAAFQQLQLDLQPQISAQMARTRQQLLEHFDDEVREKLRVQQAQSRAALDRHERLLMDLTRHELGDDADFVDDSSFVLRRSPGSDVPLGLYELPRRNEDAHIYRMAHPLAEALIERAKARELPPAEVSFHLSEHDGRISALEPLIGQSGDLAVAQLTIHALDAAEDHLILAAACDNGEVLDPEMTRRLLGLPATLTGRMPPQSSTDSTLRLIEQQRTAVIDAAAQRNVQFFATESEKLDQWADDLKAGLEREIKELDRQIREARKQAKLAPTLVEKL
ncbi:MAG: DEAD/DEAH box helicase, partial [Chloroflexota bacterium]|nr:DEAD/DEAH box helicase [Chloroflexota bacterium]